MKRFFLSFLAVVLVIGGGVGSAVAEGQVPTKYGLGLTYGHSYDPDEDDLSWLQAYGVALFDYDTIWPHAAPEPLRFKVEASAGVTVDDDTRAIMSANIMALYFLEGLTVGNWRPYVEAGVGVIYTDFQVDGQGLRINFNPQLGVGTEYTCPEGIDWFLALRAHHISNSGLDDDNRGINSVTFTIGRFF